MGMDLYGEGGYRRFATERWKRFLHLLKIFGWEPKGTISEDSPDWSGGYETNDGQIVTAEDALAMADALERALVYYPRDDMEETISYQLKTNLWAPPNPEQRAALENYMKRGDEDELKNFVIFCRSGPFKIQ